MFAPSRVARLWEKPGHRRGNAYLLYLNFGVPSAEFLQLPSAGSQDQGESGKASYRNPRLLPRPVRLWVWFGIGPRFPGSRCGGGDGVCVSWSTLLTPTEAYRNACRKPGLFQSCLVRAPRQARVVGSGAPRASPAPRAEWLCPGSAAPPPAAGG